MGIFENSALKYESEQEFWKKPTKQSDETAQLFNQLSKKTRDTNSNLSQLTSFQNRLQNLSYLNNTNSKTTQAVIKIISKQTGSTQVRRLLDYISRADKLEKEHLSIECDEGRDYKTKAERENLIKEWKEDFASKEKYQKQQWKLDIIEDLETKRQKLNKIPEENLTQKQQEELEKLTDQIDNQYITRKVKDKKTGLFKTIKQDLKVRIANDTTHMLLSVGGTPNEEKATKATGQFLKENIAPQGFKYIFVKHNDTNNLHYHVVIKNKSEFGKNLRFDKADLFALRQEYAKTLSLSGIERISTLKRDRTQTLEKIHKDLSYLKERDSWYQSQLKKLPNNTNKEINFNVYSYRSKLLNQTNYLTNHIQKQIKEYGGNKQKQLKEDLKYLQTFKKEIQTQDPKTIQIAKEKTINYLQKENKALSKKLEDLNTNPESHKAKTLTIYDKKKRSKHLNALFKKHIEELKDARKAISISKDSKSLNKDDHKKSLEIIDNMIKNSKSLTKGRGLSM